MKKENENLGKMCFLKVLKLIKTATGGFPTDINYLPFIVVAIVRGGYLIQDEKVNTYKVKNKDIYFTEK